MKRNSLQWQVVMVERLMLYYYCLHYLKNKNFIRKFVLKQFLKNYFCNIFFHVNITKATNKITLFCVCQDLSIK